MFDDWMNVWREAVESFDRELHADDGGGGEHARSMRRQLTAARAALMRIDTEIERALADALAEREAQQVCIRRQSMAAAIPDEETAHIAGEYAERHAKRADIFERKTSILREERDLMAADLAIMESDFAAHVASVSNAGAGAVEDEDEVESGPRRRSRIIDSEVRAEERAEQERHDAELARLRRERAASEKLEELKRRMRS